MLVELVGCAKDFIGSGMGVLMSVNKLSLSVIMTEEEGVL